MNTYRLLRSNKEIGPFSLEELVSKGLKPYDLIWVEHKSAAWRYPSEISELKSFAPVVEEQPYDRFYKKSEKPISAVQLEPAPNVKKEKPRFRITAVSRKLDQVVPPVAVPEKTIAEPIQHVQPEHSAFLPKATSVSGSLATFNHYTNHWNESEQPELTTKYQGSLDDIKRRYEEKILNTHKPNLFFRYAWLLIIPILAAGIWLGYKISVPEESKGIAVVPKPKLETVIVTNATLPSEEKKDEVVQERSATESKVSSIPKPLAVSQKSRSIAPPVSPAGTRQTETPRVPNNQVVKKEQRIIPQRDEIKLPAPQSTAIVVPQTEGRQARTREEKPITPAVNTNAQTSVPTPAKELRRSQAGSSKKIDDYVVVDGDYKKLNNSIQDLSLKVENVTPYPIDLVVLDIQYFDKNGRLQKGETVYAKNIAPRRDVVVNAPAGNNAYSVGYKVSLVSAEKAGLYLIAE